MSLAVYHLPRYPFSIQDPERQIIMQAIPSPTPHASICLSQHIPNHQLVPSKRPYHQIQIPRLPSQDPDQDTKRDRGVSKLDGSDELILGYIHSWTAPLVLASLKL